MTETQKQTYDKAVITPDKYNRIDCVITENDFDTSHPNSNRIDRVACEINRYLKHKWEITGENEGWYI